MARREICTRKSKGRKGRKAAATSGQEEEGTRRTEMEKVKADLEKEQQRNAEKMQLVRIMLSFEKRTFEWNDDTELL